MKPNDKTKVLVCLSGGVDSSVTAALLVEQGFAVTAAFMRQWSDSKELNGVCSWKEDRRDAMRVAAHLGIPLLTLNFEKEYEEEVLSYMFSEYENGRTPNPDVLCNEKIKFGVWLKAAQKLGFDYLATGHYAQIENKDEKYYLKEAVDKEKDQTYFLHRLNQEQLSHTLFPIGHLTKKEVRKIAETINLPTAKRAESMGICFIGEKPMKEFLQQKIKKNPGNIVDSKSKIVGKHEGLSFYTIGQRHGFEQIGGGEPLFVIAKNKENNELIVGTKKELENLNKMIILENVHFISGENPKFPVQCKVRLRHRGELKDIILKKENNELTFECDDLATPGQFAVFYKDSVCLGGGIIK